MLHIECATCGVWFGITEYYDGRRRDDHKDFYCPNGHTNVYLAPKVTVEQEKINELERVLERRAQTYRAVLDREQELMRAMRVCPICEQRVTKAQFVETIRAKVAEHLRSEHGARARLRAITEKATA